MRAGLTAVRNFNSPFTRLTPAKEINLDIVHTGLRVWFLTGKINNVDYVINFKTCDCKKDKPEDYVYYNSKEEINLKAKEDLKDIVENNKNIDESYDYFLKTDDFYTIITVAFNRLE